jgi:hypothetical protein
VILMRRMLSVFIVIFLVSCSTSNSSKTASTSDGKADTTGSAVTIVEKLYSQFGRGYIENNARDASRLLDQPLSVYEQFFTSRLATLIVTDRAEEVRTKELGRIDCSILFGSQDCEGVKNIRVKQDPTSEDVVVLYDQGGEKDVMKLRCIMDKTNIGWRISDIRYKTRVTKCFPGPVMRWSLLKALSE